MLGATKKVAITRPCVGRYWHAFQNGSACTSGFTILQALGDDPKVQVTQGRMGCNANDRYLDR